MTADVVALLSGISCQQRNELTLQAEIEKRLTAAGVGFQREKRVDNRNRLDFYLPDTQTAIETKVAGSAAALLRQAKRYADHPDIAGRLNRDGLDD